VILKKAPISIIPQYAFTSTAGKVANAKAYQRNMLEIQKLVEVVM
jgi:hypothetical protein